MLRNNWEMPRNDEKKLRDAQEMMKNDKEI